jgi:hypothetical protein
MKKRDRTHPLTPSPQAHKIPFIPLRKQIKSPLIGFSTSPPTRAGLPQGPVGSG